MRSILNTCMYVGWARAWAAVCLCVCVLVYPPYQQLVVVRYGIGWKTWEHEAQENTCTCTHTLTPFHISGATHTHSISINTCAQSAKRTVHFIFCSLSSWHFSFHRISTHTAKQKENKEISAYLFMHNRGEFGQRALIFASNTKRSLWILSERAFQTIAEFQ